MATDAILRVSRLWHLRLAASSPTLSSLWTFSLSPSSLNNRSNFFKNYSFLALLRLLLPLQNLLKLMFLRRFRAFFLPLHFIIDFRRSTLYLRPIYDVVTDKLMLLSFFCGESGSKKADLIFVGVKYFMKIVFVIFKLYSCKDLIVWISL